MTTRRVWLLVNLAVTVALAPALFTGSDAAPSGPVAVSAGPTLQTLPIAATAVPGSSNVVVLGATDLAVEGATPPPPPPTSSTVPPRRAVSRSAAPTKPASPLAVPKPQPVAAPRPVAKAPAPRPAPAPAPAPAASASAESGKASWYDHQPGICAHKSLPFGTVVTVTDTANGKSVKCTVGDRGPYVDGWVIDLNPREFEQLAPRSTGVIPVRLTW